MLESDIKRDCTKKLQSCGWMVIHLIQTNLNGITDTMILRKGEAIFIEWKRPGKTPEPLQEYRHKKLREAGFEVIVARGIEDIQHLK